MKHFILLILASVTVLAQTATFNSVRLTAPITITNQATTKAYVDAAVAGAGAGLVRSVGDSNVTVNVGDSTFVIVTNYTASRTFTLPLASAVPAGWIIRIIDNQGTVGSASNRGVVLARSGSDTINGSASSATFTSTYGMITVSSDGVSRWSANGISAASKVVLGTDSLGSGSQAVSIGNGVSASGGNAVAIGNAYATTASGTGAVAIGNGATAGGSSTVAIGNAKGTGNSTVVIGAGAEGRTIASAVVIGQNTVNGDRVTNGQTAAIIIGQNAKFSGATNGWFGESSVVIGNGAEARDGAGVVIGSQAFAEDVSSVVIGRGAYGGTNVSHAVVLGRGAYIPDNANTTTTYVTNSVSGHIALGFNGAVGGGPENGVHLWIGSGFRHRYVDTYGATIESNPPKETFLHGNDALDEGPSPTTNNVAGGALNILAGRSTGTAAGGVINLQTSPAGGVSNNVKNNPVTAVQIDANTTAGETRLLLWDVTAGTLQRVSIGATDSGGTGFRVLRIPN